MSQVLRESKSQTQPQSLGQKVLVIDDDIAFNEILKEQLEWDIKRHEP